MLYNTSKKHDSGNTRGVIGLRVNFDGEKLHFNHL